MKRILLFGISMFVLFFVSCAEDENVVSEVVNIQKIEKLDAKVATVTDTSATVEWTVKTSGVAEVTYDVFLSNAQVAEKIEQTQFTFENLKPNTEYELEVVAYIENGVPVRQKVTFKTQMTDSPGAFTINVSDIEQTTATLTWTEAKDPKGLQVVYAVYVNDTKIADKVLEIKPLELTDLLPNKEQKVRIVASNVKELESVQEYSFTTLGTPPSAFTVMVTDPDPEELVIEWTKPTVEDGSDFTYTILIDGEEIDSDIDAETTSYIIRESLNEGELYVLKMIAIADNGLRVESTVSVTTKSIPGPSAFEITPSVITNTSFTLNWTASTVSDNSAVEYTVYLDGEELNSTQQTGMIISGLQRDTEYQIEVVATAQNEARKSISAKATVITANTYDTHPTIEVERAFISSSNGIIIRLNVDIFSINIEEIIIADDIRLANFFVTGPTISTGTQSSENLAKIRSNNQGRFVFIKDGKTYQANFEVEIP